MGGLMGGLMGGSTAPQQQPIVMQDIAPPEANDQAALAAEQKRLLQERQKTSQRTNILTGNTGDTSTPTLGKKILLGE